MFCWKIIFILEALFFIFDHDRVGGFQQITMEEDMDYERQLLVLNKQTINIVQTEGGIYDCINIYKQPALYHPLLKNHKIQIRPSYETKHALYQTKSRLKQASAKHEIINCPKGTVPIRRTQKEDLIRWKQFIKSYPKDIFSLMKDFPSKHVVALIPSKPRAIYHGVMGDISIHGLDVKDDQYSTGQLWVEKGIQSNQYTSIQAGWMISPHVAGNNDTRLFIYWTDEISQKGCFNHLCPGFVQVHPNLTLGMSFFPLSKYGGKRAYGITIGIYQDNVTGNWWLRFNSPMKGQSDHVGYWPKSFLPGLNGDASVVSWGGLAAGPPMGDSPPMGNGHYPYGDFSRAAFIKELRIVDSSNHLVTPPENEMVRVVDNSKCYGLEYHGHYDRGGLAFMYGGPGGKCGI